MMVESNGRGHHLSNMSYLAKTSILGLRRIKQQQFGIWAFFLKKMGY